MNHHHDLRAIEFICAAVLLGASALAAYGEEFDDGTMTAAEVKKLLKGMDKAAISFVQFDVAPDGQKPKEFKGKTLHGKAILSETILKDQNAIDEIRSALTSPLSYSSGQKIDLEPGFGLSFQLDDKTIDFVISNNQVNGYRNDDEKRWALSDDGYQRLLRFYKGQTAAAKAVAALNNLLKGLDNAEITFFKIDSDSENQKPEERKGKMLQRWTILSESVLKDAKKKEEVRAVLTDPKTYGGTGMMCFEPGLAFRFHDGDRTVDFVICLACNWVYGYEGEKVRSWALSKEGKERLLNLYNAQIKADADAGAKCAADVKELLKGMENAEITFFSLWNNPENENLDSVKGEILRNWKIMQNLVLKDAESCDDLKAVLADPNTYADTGVKDFKPDLAFRFKDGDKTIDFVIDLMGKLIHCYHDKTDITCALSEKGFERLRDRYCRAMSAVSIEELKELKARCSKPKPEEKK